MAAERAADTRTPPGLGRGLGNPLGQFFRRVVCEGSVEATHRRAGGSPGIRAARDYYDAIERGALNSRIADAELATAKAVVSDVEDDRAIVGRRRQVPPQPNGAKRSRARLLYFS